MNPTPLRKHQRLYLCAMLRDRLSSLGQEFSPLPTQPQLSWTWIPLLICLLSCLTHTHPIQATLAQVDSRPFLIQSLSVNLAPIISGLEGPLFVDDRTPIKPFGTMTITDPDGEPGQLKVRIRSTTSPGWVYSDTGPFTLTETGEYAFSGSPDQVTEAIRQIEITPLNNSIPVSLSHLLQFTVRASDQEGSTARHDTTGIWIESVNDVPLITSDQRFFEMDDKETIRPFEFFTVEDPDVLDFFSADVLLEDLELGMISDGDTSGFLLNRLAGLEPIQDWLQNLVFIPHSNRVAPGETREARVSLIVSDRFGAVTRDEGVLVRITEQNDPPQIEFESKPVEFGDNEPVRLFSGISLFDPDLGETELRVEIKQNPTLAGRLEGIDMDSEGVYRLQGMETELEQRLKDLLFDPRPNLVSPRSTYTVTFEFKLAEVALDSESRAVHKFTIRSIDDPPLIEGIQSIQDVDEGATIFPFSALKLSEPDPGQENDILTVHFFHDMPEIGSFQSHESFVEIEQGRWRMNGTLPEIQSALNKWVYQAGRDEVAAEDAVIVDLTLTLNSEGEGEQTYEMGRLQVNSVNHAPVFIGYEEQITMQEGQTIFPFSEAFIQDPDRSEKDIRFRIRATPEEAGELQLTEAFTEGDKGWLEVIETESGMNELLPLIAFSAASNQVPSGEMVRVQLNIELSELDSDSANLFQVHLEIESVNELPIITGTRSDFEITEKESLLPFAEVTVEDPDRPHETIEVEVTIVDPLQGFFERLNGFMGLGEGRFHFSGSAQEVTEALQGMTFKPTDNRVAPEETETISLLVMVSDPANEPVKDSRTQILVSGVNDPVEIRQGSEVPEGVDHSPIYPFVDLTLVDPDPGHGPVRLTVRLQGTGLGNLVGDSFFSRSNGNTLSGEGDLETVNEALKTLFFLPLANQFSPGTTREIELQVTVTDLEFDAVTSTIQGLRVVSENDPPQILGDTLPAGDPQSHFPFRNLTIEDVDRPVQDLQVTLTLENPDAGAFFGQFKPQSAMPGSFEFTGNKLAATVAIQSLAFVPGQFDPEPVNPIPDNPDSDRDGRTDAQEFLEGTNRFDTRDVLPSLLSRWDFNNLELRGEYGEDPINIVDTKLTTGVDQQALEMNAGGQANLRYRLWEEDSSINLNPYQGALRFWFRPHWSSSALGGQGPGDWASLVELGEWSPDARLGWWSLSIHPDGSRIRFDTQAGGQEATAFSWPITFQEGKWHEILYNYHPEFTSLFLDGRPIVFGSGLSTVPDWSNIARNGLNIGSDLGGNFQVRGDIDHFEAYNVVMGTSELLAEQTAVSASALPDSPSLRLHWKNRKKIAIDIQRKTLDTPNWSLLKTTSSEWSYLETDIEPGNIYEYQVEGQYLLGGWQARTDAENRGNVLVLVDESLATEIVPEFGFYLLDLWGDGWKVRVERVPRGIDSDKLANVERVKQVKGLIQSVYEELNGDLTALVLVGHVPVPYSGWISPDGHFSRAWPTDLYYADAVENSPWTDVQNRSLNLTGNVPGDGIFDHDVTPSLVELAVGRIDMANMPAFSLDPPEGVQPLSEVDLIKRYFRKNHGFRQGEIGYHQRAIAKSFHRASSGRSINLYRTAWTQSSRLFGEGMHTLVEDDLFTSPLAFIIGFQSAPSSLESINCCDLPDTHSTFDLAIPENEHKTGFLFLEGSFFGDWNAENNFLKAVIMQRAYGLTSLWIPKISLRLSKLGLGFPLAHGLLDTINNISQFRDGQPNIILSLMGDPTLRLQVLPPIDLLAPVRNEDGTMTISWTQHPFDDVEYRIYQLIGDQYTLIGQTASLKWEIEDPFIEDYEYMVRVTMEQHTGSGSFINFSQGAFVPGIPEN